MEPVSYTHLFGAPIARLDSTAYEQIGILSDNSGVYERMSIYENMKLFADPVSYTHLDVYKRQNVVAAVAKLWMGIKAKVSSLLAPLKPCLLYTSRCV